MFWIRRSKYCRLGYIDAGFVGNVDDRKSTNGYVFLFGGTTVSWLSKKQNYVEKSTIEGEYISSLRKNNFFLRGVFDMSGLLTCQ